MKTKCFLRKSESEPRIWWGFFSYNCRKHQTQRWVYFYRRCPFSGCSFLKSRLFTPCKSNRGCCIFFLGFPLSAIICNSRSLAVLPYCLRFDVISVLQSFSLDLQNNCLDVLHFYLQYALQYLILICSWKLNFVRKKITISYVAFVGLSEHKTPPGIKLSTSEKFDLDWTFYIWKLEPGSAWEKSLTNLLACP